MTYQQKVLQEFREKLNSYDKDGGFITNLMESFLIKALEGQREEIREKVEKLFFYQIDDKFKGDGLIMVVRMNDVLSILTDKNV